MSVSVRGADLEAKDINNYTPIMRAIACGRLSTVIKLLEGGCEVDTVVRHQKTLLEWAIENEYNVLIEVKIPVLLLIVIINTYIRHCVSIQVA